MPLIKDKSARNSAAAEILLRNRCKQGLCVIGERKIISFLDQNFVWNFHIKVLHVISFLLISPHPNWICKCDYRCSSANNKSNEFIQLIVEIELLSVLYIFWQFHFGWCLSTRLNLTTHFPLPCCQHQHFLIIYGRFLKISKFIRWGRQISNQTTTDN